MKALVVGCGSVGRRHIKNLLKIDKIKKIFVCTKISGCKRLFDNEYEKLEIIRRIEDTPFVDFALVCNETYKHYQTAKFLAEKGINLFVEKPVFNSLKNTGSFRKLIQKKKIKLTVGYNLRFLGALELLKTTIKDSTLGRLYFSQIEAGQYLPDWRENIDYRKSYSADIRKGGGVGLDLSHEIDYMRYLFGNPRAWKTFKGKVSRLDIKSDDIFEGVYFFKNNFICNIHLDYLQKEKRRTIRIVGEKGEIFCDLINKYMKITKNGKTRIVRESNLFDLDETYLKEIRDFIYTIEKDKQPKARLEDGIWALRLIGADRHV